LTQPIFRSRRSFFGQSYEENQVQKIRHTIRHTILKTANLRFVPGNAFSRGDNTIVEDIILYAWAPHTDPGFTIVKSAMRLINSGNLHIKKHYAVLAYAWGVF
jgi:hypothetical protein